MLQSRVSCQVCGLMPRESRCKGKAGAILVSYQLHESFWSNILRHLFEHLGHVCKNLGLYNLHSEQSLCHVELNVTDKEWILTHHLCNGGSSCGGIPSDVYPWGSSLSSSSKQSPSVRLFFTATVVAASNAKLIKGHLSSQVLKLARSRLPKKRDVETNHRCSRPISRPFSSDAIHIFHHLPPQR